MGDQLSHTTLNHVGHKTVCNRQKCSFYLRDAMLAQVIGTATCLSVCLSVTRRYCVKTKKATGLHAVSKIFVEE